MMPIGHHQETGASVGTVYFLGKQRVKAFEQNLWLLLILASKANLIKVQID